MPFLSFFLFFLELLTLFFSEPLLLEEEPEDFELSLDELDELDEELEEDLSLDEESEELLLPLRFFLPCFFFFSFLDFLLFFF